MEDKHKFPVCGKHEFEEWSSFEMCPVCGWFDDGIQADDHDYKGGRNKASVNEARRAYKSGKTFE